MFGIFQKKEDTQIDREIFVIGDNKVGNYKEPFFAQNRFDVLRQFDQLMCDQEQAAKGNKYVAYAEDFTLYKIGEYSLKTGLIYTCEPEAIARLIDIKNAAVQRMAMQRQKESVPLRDVQ